MKPIRAVFLSCIAAALLVLPVTAQAWMFEITDLSTGSTSKTSIMNFSIASSSGALSSKGYTFTVVSDVSGMADTTLDANMNYTAGGLKNYISIYNDLGDSTGKTLTNPVGTGSQNFFLTSNTVYYMDLLSRAAKGSSSSFTGTVSISTPDAKTPIPAAALLLGSGVLGLVGIGKARRKSEKA